MPTPSLVLLPGLFDDGSMWSHQSEHLADICEPLPIDLVDHDCVEAFADLVLSTAPESFALVGFSMGGYVAFEILRRAPNRVTKLALIDTGPRADAPEKADDRLRQIELARTGGYSKIVNAALPTAVHESRADDEALLATLREMALRVGADAFVRQQQAIMSRPDSRALLASIDCPTLVICGREDVITPVELSEEMAANIPAAELVLVEDCNHYAPMERPYTVTALLRRWLMYG